MFNPLQMIGTSTPVFQQNSLTHNTCQNKENQQQFNVILQDQMEAYAGYETKYATYNQMCQWNDGGGKYCKDEETGVTYYENNRNSYSFSPEEKLKLLQYCEENGVAFLAKFAEMTGYIKHFEEGSIFIGDNGALIQSYDGKKTLNLHFDQYTSEQLIEKLKQIEDVEDLFDEDYWKELLNTIKSA